MKWQRGFYMTGIEIWIGVAIVAVLALAFISMYAEAKEWHAFRAAHNGGYKNIFFVRPDSDADPLLPLTDILVTDYSGIYFEFLLLDRPVVFFAFDYEKYVSQDRELYFPYGEVTPGPKAKNLRELMGYLAEVSAGRDDDRAYVEPEP